MAIVCREIKGQKEIVYIPPEIEVLREKSNALVRSFQLYAKGINLSFKDVHIQEAILPRVVLRVDKREGYFTVFHDGTQINEIKQAALTAYWIIKFKPFMIDVGSVRR